MTELIWSVQEQADEALLRAVEAAVETALSLEGRRGAEVAVEIVPPEAIRALNRDFRRVDAVTDVLSFPAWEGEALPSPPDGYLGDIAICYARAAEQAAAYGHSLLRELAFLAAHGALHLLGCDHILPEDEAAMRRKQNEVMKELKLER
ncbi:MAG: rRNA maturation RNase YbeY [Clostridia bacterium]|nr:rRNA maturation RNase YbeY [Clostridia bacterium]